MEESKNTQQNTVQNTQQNVQQQAPKNSSNSNANLDRKIEDKVNALNKNLDDKILSMINNKKQGDNTQSIQQIDVGQSLVEYFNVKSICLIDYSDYQLIALVTTIIICILVKLLDMFPVLNIPILIGYLIYILVVVVKEKIWNLMVR